MARPMDTNPDPVRHLPGPGERAMIASVAQPSSGMPGRVPSPTEQVAVVTGASSGIGAATARRLAQDGFHVVATARRSDRLAQLVDELTEAGQVATAVTCDVTSDTQVAELAEFVRAISAPATLLVNNAGGALGLDPIERGDVQQWRQMYETNVLGTLRVTKALLPELEASGASTVVIIGSTAGLAVYENGGGYIAAKHAEVAFAQTLRLELCGRPIRVVEIDPGLVHTEEFSLVRFGGDAQRAEAVYAGIPNPLMAEDIADCVSWVASRPHHVNVDRLVVRPLAQAANHKVHRSS